MKSEVKDNRLWFSCGCSFAITESGELEFNANLRDPNHTINFECAQTWKDLGDGFTEGIFQLESPLGNSYTRKLKPENIEHITALGSILRPGSLESRDEDGVSITQHYCNIKNGVEQAKPYHPIVDEVLKDTYGQLIYQEQSMRLASEVAGFNLVEADILRKSIGKKLVEEMCKSKKLFIDKGKELGKVDNDKIEEIFSWIEKSQRYQFNRSHSASYGITGYICSYIKTHFPLLFYTAWLRRDDDRKKLPNVVNEAKKFADIQVCVPNLLHAQREFYVKDKRIYFGLNNIKGVATKSADKLIELVDDKTKQLTWPELIINVLNKLDKTTCEGLILVGAIDYIRQDRQRLLIEYREFSSLTEKEVEKAVAAGKKYTTVAELIKAIIDNKWYHSKTRLPKLEKSLDYLVNPISPLVDTVDSILFNEQNLLGVGLTYHRSDNLKSSTETHSCIDIINGHKDFATLKVNIDKVKTHVDKKGNTMAFLEISDHSCTMNEVVVFANEYAEFGQLLSEDRLLFISGKKSGNSFIVNRAYYG